jgi:hypothetical protein
MTRGCCPRGGASIITGLLAGLFLVLVTVLSVDAAGTATSTKGTATTTKQQTQPTTTQQQQQQTADSTGYPLLDAYLAQDFAMRGPYVVAGATPEGLTTFAGKRTRAMTFAGKQVQVVDIQGRKLTLSDLKPLITKIFILTSGNQIGIVIMPKEDKPND